MTSDARVPSMVVILCSSTSRGKRQSDLSNANAILCDKIDAINRSGTDGKLERSEKIPRGRRLLW